MTSTRVGSTLYVGGYFKKAGPVTGTCVMLDAASGALRAGWPSFVGEVFAATPDGRGGWFVGGKMTAIDGKPHGGLAHLDSRGQLRAWNPNPDGEVLAMAVLGDTLFVGGWFEHVDGTPRPHLAAFRISRAELLPPLPAPNGPVRALLADGGRLFVGGTFDRLGGALRGPVAACDLGRWDLSDWRPVVPDQPLPGVFGSVSALATLEQQLLVGGSLFPGGRCLAAFSMETGEVADWIPTVTGPSDSNYGDPEIRTIAIEDTTIYVGGRFTSVAGLRRGGLAKIGFTSGIVDSWDPRQGPWYGDFSSIVSSLLVNGGTVYLGGFFETVGDSSRSFIAAVDAESGALRPWGVGMSSGVRTLSESGGRMLVGGNFVGAGSQWNEERDCLAAFDLTTGALKAWNPGISGLGVETLAAIGGRIIVGGFFYRLGGQARYCFGAVDTLTGTATGWEPASDGAVLELKAVGDTLYAGGSFTSLGGQPRANIARFDMAAEVLTPWAPTVDNYVGAIEPAGDHVFLGGSFHYVNGVERAHLAAVDVATGALGEFDARLDYGPSGMAAGGDTLYVAGSFRVLDDPITTPLSVVVALDRRTGRKLFLVEGEDYATSIVKVDSVLYVSGLFTRIGGASRLAFAALSARSGTVLPLDARLNEASWGVASYDGTVFAFGRFLSAFDRPAGGLLGLRTDLPPAPEQAPLLDLAFTDLWPNPASGRRVSLGMTLPGPGSLSIDLLDIQGRRVVSALRRRPVNAGRFRVELPIGDLKEGVYFCRVDWSGRAVSKKFLVIR